MSATAERILAWSPEEETIIPNNHGVLASFTSWSSVEQSSTPGFDFEASWNGDDDTVVPGHHQTDITFVS